MKFLISKSIQLLVAVVPLVVPMVALSTMPAYAHWGHLGEMAGHGHLIGAAALAAAAAIAAALLFAREDDEDTEEEQAEPEAEGETA